MQKLIFVILILTNNIEREVREWLWVCMNKLECVQRKQDRGCSWMQASLLTGLIHTTSYQPQELKAGNAAYLRLQSGGWGWGGWVGEGGGGGGGGGGGERYHSEDEEERIRYLRIFSYFLYNLQPFHHFLWNNIKFHYFFVLSYILFTIMKWLENKNQFKSFPIFIL